jgi:uroporphyrinogen-III synthase
MLANENFNGDVLIYPLLEIEFLKKNIKFNQADALIFTSIYALENFQLEVKGVETPVFAVGKRCDDMLKDIGVTNSFIFSNVRDLKDSLKKNYGNQDLVVFYLRGEEVSCDLSADLLANGFKVMEHIVYRQKSVNKQKKLEKILARNKLEGIALFSEKSVDRLVNCVSRKNLNKKFFCFSKKIENRLRFYLGENITCKTTHEPLIAEMVNLIVKEFSNCNEQNEKALK